LKSKHKQKLSQTQLQRLQQCCGEIHEDDCIDPRKFFQPERDNKENHKGKQLCRQAFETLSLVLADCDDELMQFLNLIEVRASSDGSKLVTTVEAAHVAQMDTHPGKFTQQTHTNSGSRIDSTMTSSAL